MSNLVPDGQVNRSLTRLDIRGNKIRGEVGKKKTVLALASRCTNLSRLVGSEGLLNLDQRRGLNLLLERKRLVALKLMLVPHFPACFDSWESKHTGINMA
jgi:hypothetical protein